VYLSSSEGFDLWSAAKRQRRVLLALMLRNIRTRFFGHGLGYLIAIAWPLTHILIVVAVFTLLGRVAPYGDSVVLFIPTGTVTFMSCFMMISVLSEFFDASTDARNVLLKQIVPAALVFQWLEPIVPKDKEFLLLFPR
jgi:ABC-type polysaccharide/polyol phosphate export permease